MGADHQGVRRTRRLTTPPADCRRHPRSAGAATPLFDACGPVYDAAMAQGFGSADTASVCEVLARRRPEELVRIVIAFLDRSFRSHGVEPAMK